MMLFESFGFAKRENLGLEPDFEVCIPPNLGPPAVEVEVVKEFEVSKPANNLESFRVGLVLLAGFGPQEGRGREDLEFLEVEVVALDLFGEGVSMIEVEFRRNLCRSVDKSIKSDSSPMSVVSIIPGEDGNSRFELELGFRVEEEDEAITPLTFRESGGVEGDLKLVFGAILAMG